MGLSTAGQLAVYGALGASIITFFAAIRARLTKDERWATVTARAMLCVALFSGAAVLLLFAVLALHDFSNAYVANYTSRSTPRVYTFSALWAGMEGSLLFWAFLTAVYSATATWSQRGRRADLAPIAAAVMSVGLIFFFGLTATASSPFEIVTPAPLDGNGLNPLLQSPFMAIHPVMLYLGLTGTVVPFAFALASLISGRIDVRWFTSTRRWTVLSWSFLTVGIILGGAWAYSELGWGGYWAWDPVENASFIPWLTGTAFLHSVLIQERRGMLKVWNVALILSTYSLAIFGTFLTRSGLLTSVHTFSESPVGRAILPFLGVVVVGAFAILGWRLDRLRSTRQLDAFWSRESMFLFNNLLFVVIALTVLWGTIYPIIVEAIDGAKISVGPPFYNSVVTPVGIALLALTGIGPLVAWRKASVKALRRQFAIPLIAGAATIAALAAGGVRSASSLFALSLCVFVTVATVGEFVRGAAAHRTAGPVGWLVGLGRVVSRNRRRYGGYVVHLGVVLIFLGLSGTSFRLSWTGDMQVGDSFVLGDYRITYIDARTSETEEKFVNMAIMKVERDGEQVATLRPQRNFHFAQRQPQSEIGLHTTLSEDLYLVLTQMDESGQIVLRAWVNPLVAWLWIGGGVMSLGMLIILSAKPAAAVPTALPRAKEPEMVGVR